MKKALSLILALVMCLSLSACGNSTEEVPAAPKVEEIELTAENWKEYFDTENVVLSCWWEKNEFGEILQLLEVTFYYPLKEEYRNRIVNIENVEIVYEVIRDRGSVDCTINFQEEVVTLNGAWVSNGKQLTMTERFSGSRIVKEGLRVGSIQTQGFVEPTETPTSAIMEGSYFNNITRIQGTLYISE